MPKRKYVVIVYQQAKEGESEYDYKVVIENVSLSAY
jgi:hypothetical protein